VKESDTQLHQRHHHHHIVALHVHHHIFGRTARSAGGFEP
jgi:hypothetical protein